MLKVKIERFNRNRSVRANAWEYRSTYRIIAVTKYEQRVMEKITKEYRVIGINEYEQKSRGDKTMSVPCNRNQRVQTEV